MLLCETLATCVDWESGERGREDKDGGKKEVRCVCVRSEEGLVVIQVELWREKLMMYVAL